MSEEEKKRYEEIIEALKEIRHYWEELNKKIDENENKTEQIEEQTNEEWRNDHGSI